MLQLKGSMLSMCGDQILNGIRASLSKIKFKLQSHVDNNYISVKHMCVCMCMQSLFNHRKV